MHWSTRLLFQMNRFWRPLWAWLMLLVILTNQVIIPLLLQQAAIDVVPLVVASASLLPLAILRSYEKHRGLTDKS